ncbi:hypothetical protein EJ06DRAFT_547970 [Trichodelitschia bisporula]|uniref:EthD domain-containing protein n=1 Tax=Trichodelitschia bisporula TaxID=703511 RepID=A0A6G1I096_9PEZI|nr:hypothetical protein EJ06DRAFT_547970 [Trichodelitschia bisporula]
MAENLAKPPFPFTGPGLLIARSRITSPELSEDVFERWYNEVHIPDVLAVGTISAAYRFRNSNPAAEVPYLAVYTVPEFSKVDMGKLGALPMAHEMLPGGGTITDFVDIDSQFYKLTQEEAQKLSQDAYFPVLLSAAMEPAAGGEADFDAWYREEHLDQMAKEPGHKRARRYRLAFQNTPAGMSGADAPSWLTLYEFDESGKEKLGTEVKPLDPMTPWTKRMLETAQRVEAAIYYRIF